MTKPIFHRRRTDRPLSIDDAVTAEGPIEHLRNALSIIRVAMDFMEVYHGNGGPSVVIRISDLAAVQRRIEAATSILESDKTL